MNTHTSHIAIATEPLNDGVLVEARAHGTLDGDDYDVLLPELNALLANGQKLRFLLILDDFHGWDVESFWRELRWDEQNRDRLERVAIIGEAAWQKWSTLLTKWFVPGNVRYFDRGEEPAAREWLRAR